MMLKSKICFTVLVIYEILAVILMHMTRICTAMFGMNFCADGGFKYFIACFAIPMLALLIAMWIREIVVASERHHSIMHKAKHALTDIVDDVRERFTDNITPKDIEKFLAAAAIVGISRYAQTHPKTKRMFDNIVATARGQKTTGYDDDDDDDASDDDEEDIDVEYAEYDGSAHNMRNGRAGVRNTSRASASRTKSRIKK